MPDRPELLLIEDEPVVRAAVTRTLESEGWVVVTREDGRGVESLLASSRFRVVLCDLMLPGTSGFALLDLSLRSEPTRPFVLITGYATPEKKLEAFRAGAFDFLPKPFDTAELVGVVERAGLFAAPTRPPGAPDGGVTYHLGRHSWARLEEDGSATIGVGDTFAAVLSRIDQMELPVQGEVLLQTRRLAQLRCGDRATHALWSPLSGRIVAVHEAVAQNPGLLSGRDASSNWLVRLVPRQAELELPLLRHETTDGCAQDSQPKGEQIPWSLRSSS